MELEPISYFSQRSWGFHTVRGGDDLKELGFIPRFVQLLEIYNGLRNGDGTLSSPGGAGSMIYDPQPIRDRPVGGVGNYFHCAERRWGWELFPHCAERYQS